MSGIELTEVVAWALIAAGAGYLIAERMGRQGAVVAATLAALATKSALLGLV